MKYVVDLTSLIKCLDYLDCIKVNNIKHISLPLLKEFIEGFPSEKVKEEYAEYQLDKKDTEGYRGKVRQ